MATPGAHQPGGADIPRAHTPPNPSNSSIPVFSPRTPRHGARPPTPESDSDSSSSSISLDNLPKGHLLVVRGCVSTNAAETPVSLVQDAIANIASDPSLSYLLSLPIVVSPFHERISTKSSACYVEIKLPAAGEPRIDLLETVKTELERGKPNWEVRWSACKKGGSYDKRMSCRLLNLYPGVTDREGIPSEHLDPIKAHIESKGFKVANIFASYGGPQVTFLLPHDADRFMALRRISMPPKISKHEALIEPVKEIPILRAFELVVGGTRDYDGLAELVVRWARKTSPKCFLEVRSDPSNSDLIIFSMTTWDATRKILNSSSSFRKTFPESISAPRLLWDYNSNPLKKNALGDQVAKGASQISNTVAALAREVSDLKSGMAIVQRQQEALHVNQERVFGMIDSINSRITVTQNAVIAQARDQRLRTRLSDLEGRHGQIQLAILFTTDPTRLKAMQAQLENISDQVNKARGELEGSSNQLAVLMGSPAVPPPPTITAPPPPTIPQSASSDAGPSPPKRKRTQSLTSSSPVAMDPLGAQPMSTSPPLVADGDDDDELVSPNSLCSNFLGSLNEYQRYLSTAPATHEPGHATSSTTNLMGHRDWRIAQRRLIRWGPVHTYSFPAFAHFCTTVTPPVTPPDTPEPCASVPTSVPSPPSSAAPSCYFFAALPVRFPLVLVLLLLVNVASAMPATPQSSISMCALNANGLVYPVKLAFIGAMITKMLPHIFAISETKTMSNAGSGLPITNYEIFEENGVQCAKTRRGKWGIVLGVRKDIQVVSRIPLSHASLKGRVAVVDVVIPSTVNSPIHRIFAVYAPCDPNLDQLSCEFWPNLTAMVRDTQTSWSVVGDLNATVSASERASDNAHSRCLFNRFLSDTSGADLWQLTPDRNRHIDWTSRAWRSTEGGNIIDRVVTSQASLIDSEIHTDATWIPGTDHRAIVARIIIALAPTTQYSEHRNSMPYTPFMPTPPPRIKYPVKSDKHLFPLFTATVDRLIAVDKKSLEIPVTNDLTYTNRYETLTKILHQAATDTFGRGKLYKPSTKDVTSPNIKQLITKIRHLGGAILRSRGSSLARSHGALQVYYRYSVEHHSMDPPSSLSLTKYLQNIKCQLHRDLYAAKKEEIMRRAREHDRFKMLGALCGGSTKRLLNKSSLFIALPTALESISSPDIIATDPAEVSEITRQYFTNLYSHQVPPNKPKPWMTTPSVLEVRSRVERDPFIWPLSATLSDFRAMLRKGSTRPAPGPDGWEKWCVKNLSDHSLQFVLDLHNYSVIHSCFPGNITDSHLTYYHKRGVRTNLLNWRGILISNFLANSPMTWLNYNLSPYSSRLGIIPNTQVATQPGVQTRDLMSFLSGLKTWSKRNKKTVYLLKRDQMKGFDYLSPEGLYDACKAYGLPDAICDLDRAAQSSVRCLPRTAYGIAEPITIYGLTKQGGPMSPLKSTLTTSLGHHYLNDIALKNDDTVTISTTSHQLNDPHLPDDHLTLNFTMAEATDDSYIAAHSYATLCEFTLLMERFQFVYGWMTSWSKTTAHILNCTDTVPETLSFPSITVSPGVDPWTITHHDVLVTTNEFDFLRTQVDDPDTRTTELMAFIDSFTFPSFLSRTPFSLIRKIVSQNIISKCRALLSLQPISNADAIRLDQRIAKRVHDTLGFPFCADYSISTLPLNLGGFDFPSLVRINAGIAIDGLARDLNHHIPAYRTMALITLADWTCQHNGCQYPLDGKGLEKSFSRLKGKIPSSWLIAHNHMTMYQPRLSLRVTDQSHLLRGECSISHAISLLKMSTPPLATTPTVPNGHTLKSLHHMGFRQLHEIGCWSIDTYGITSFTVNSLPEINQTMAQTKNWQITSDYLSQGQITSLFSGEMDLICTRDVRKLRAEAIVAALAKVSPYPPAPCSGTRQLWGTDGSMVPATAGLLDSKSVTAAITGPHTIILKIPGRNISILQGEQMGIIAGIILAGRLDPEARIYSDHLNSVRLLDDSRTSMSLNTRLRHMNGRSYYRWMIDLYQRSLARVEYTKGHSDITGSIPSTLNLDADHYASQVQHNISNTAESPIPTFFMDQFSFFTNADGWIESNIRSYTDRSLAQLTSRMLKLKPGFRMHRSPYDPTPPPDYPYLRSISSYSAMVQLYCRAGQLPTASRLLSRNMILSNTCRFGCDALEDEHHLFVECPHFSQFRTDALSDIMVYTKTKCTEMDTGICDEAIGRILLAAKSLFTNDSSIWPLHRSTYYLGLIPDIATIIGPFSNIHPPIAIPNHNLRQRRFIHHVASEWHLRVIRLAGRIWGEVQREMATSSGF